MRHNELPAQSCEICGTPTRSTLGICSANQPCRAAYQRRLYRTERTLEPKRPCAQCGHPTRSAYGVCQSNQACHLEYQRRSKARRAQLLAEQAPAIAAEDLPADCPNCQAKERMYAREFRRLEASLRRHGIDPETEIYTITANDKELGA